MLKMLGRVIARLVQAALFIAVLGGGMFLVFVPLVVAVGAGGNVGVGARSIFPVWMIYWTYFVCAIPFVAAAVWLLVYLFRPGEMTEKEWKARCAKAQEESARRGAEYDRLSLEARIAERKARIAEREKAAKFGLGI